MLTSTARALTRRSLPAMPAAVAGVVAETVANVDGELRDLAAGLVGDAGMLLARANRAELGRFERVAWLAPSVHGFDTGDVAALEADAVFSGRDQAHQAEAWSIELLNDAPDSMASDPSGPDSLDVDIVLGPDVSSDADLPSDPLDGFTLTAAAGYDALQLQDRDDVDGPRSPAAGGALRVALQDAVGDPTGTGILGCILVGGDMETVSDDDGSDAT